MLLYKYLTADPKTFKAIVTVWLLAILEGLLV